jgi:hypothetical protein
MDEKHEPECVPLVTSELEYSRYWVVDDRGEKSKNRCSSLCLWLLLFELANVAFFVGGYSILIKERDKHQPQLDDCKFNVPRNGEIIPENHLYVQDGSLSQFNRTWDYSNHSTLGEPHESGSFYHETWEDMASRKCSLVQLVQCAHFHYVRLWHCVRQRRVGNSAWLTPECTHPRYTRRTGLSSGWLSCYALFGEFST